MLTLENEVIAICNAIHLLQVATNLQFLDFLFKLQCLNPNIGL
jgi:hypothetical protein